MRGFEDHYTDIIDFIVRVTHHIWEDKHIGYIYDHYRHNIRVIDDYGLNIGRDKVIANTIQFINAFPDIRLVANENYEEWVIYNNASLIQQLGLDLREKAREMGNRVDWDSINDKRFNQPVAIAG
jgi:hypothetical protein